MDLVELEAQARVFLAQHGVDATQAWLKQATLWNDQEAGVYVASLSQRAELDRLSQTTDQAAAGIAAQRVKGYLTAQEIAAMLEHGLFLERSQSLLPWRAPLVYLAKAGSPAAVTDAILEWPDELIFNGLSVSVSTGTLLKACGLYHLNCRPVDYAVWGDPWEGVEAELAHLSRVLGAPTEKWAWGGYQWQAGRTKVALTFHSCNEFHFSEDFHKYIELNVGTDVG